jgi:hypothetical protein
MKDEYDFSGGTRGKFYRPNSRVRLPYHRASQSWFDDVAVTGKWWQPEFWRDPDYLAASPWSRERLEAAFGALTRLYSPNEAKAAFSWVLERDAVERSRRMDRPLWRLLACPMRPDLSALLRLGFDAVDADAIGHSQLVRRLRADVPPEFNSARFELRCLAAFRNTGIEVSYEPSSGTGKGPDFRLRLPGDRFVYVDAKHAEEGAWAKEEPTDSRREVARVVRGAVARGAMQIPPEDLGLVLLNPGMHAPSHLLVEEVKRWMGAEGAGYPNLVGVLVMAEVLVEPEPGVLGRLEQIVPVWRDETPGWVKDGPWQDLSDALAARDMEALARRYAEGGDHENGDIPRSATG